MFSCGKAPFKLCGAPVLWPSTLSQVELFKHGTVGVASSALKPCVCFQIDMAVLPCQFYYHCCLWHRLCSQDTLYTGSKGRQPLALLTELVSQLTVLLIITKHSIFLGPKSLTNKIYCSQKLMNTF